MRPDPDSVQAPTELSENDIHKAASEAVEIAKQHGFGVAFPLVVASAALAQEFGAYINCWTSCGPGGG